MTGQSILSSTRRFVIPCVREPQVGEGGGRRPEQARCYSKKSAAEIRIQAEISRISILTQLTTQLAEKVIVHLRSFDIWSASIKFVRSDCS